MMVTVRFPATLDRLGRQPEEAAIAKQCRQHLQTRAHRWGDAGRTCLFTFALTRWEYCNNVAITSKDLAIPAWNQCRMSPIYLIVIAALLLLFK